MSHIPYGFARDNLARVLASLAILLGLCVAPSLAATPKETLVVAQDIDGILSLDPAEAFEQMSLQMTGLLYERLFNYDAGAEDKLVNGAAASWSVSEDGKQFTVKLKSGLKFNSGNPLTAEDVAYSLRRVALLKKSPATILAEIGVNAGNADAAVEVTAPDTIALVLPKAYAPGVVRGVLSNLAGSIVDMKTVQPHEQNGDHGNAWLKTHAAGSSIYALRAWKPDETFTVDRTRGTGLKAVIFRHVKEPGSQLLLLLRGDVDMAMNLDPDQIVSLASNHDIKVERFPRAQLIYLGLNQNVPPLTNPKVWQALRYLIDYDGIANKVLQGQYGVEQAFWPKGSPWSLEGTPFKLDAARAKALLAEAGFPDGLSVTLDVINESPYPQIGQALQASMALGGVKLQLIQSDQGAALGKYRARKHQMMLVYWGPDYLDIHSNASFFTANPDPSETSSIKTLPWRNSWTIPELTARTRSLISELDPEKRKQGYLALQREFQDQSPMIVMLQRNDLIAMRTEVEGLKLGPLMSQAEFDAVTK